MAGMGSWTVRDIPDQNGRVAVVTGANSGLGLVTTRELARAGAHVVMGCRDAARGRQAREQLVQQVPDADVEVRPLDLASLASVRAFTDRMHADFPALDLLVNNAGVMAIPRQATEDGFERQLGTNHLGHFALTGLLLPGLLGRAGSRVVTVSSTAHKPGRIDFDDLMGERSYRKWAAYSQSKLANLLFAYELARRLEAADATTISVAAHPGYAATNLQHVGPRMQGSRLRAGAMSLANRLFAQSDEMGALPQLYAATAPDVHGGEYFGPDGIAESRGHPKRVDSTSASKDRDVAARLWAVSEDLTGVRYDVLLTT
jgi:NAD(P)-dependent dehydrogenase (short-subunit alcohol dehydrogenase family)